MVLYWIMILLSCFFVFLRMHTIRKPLQKVFCDFWAIGIPVIIAAFRYNNGSDYQMYARIYNAVITNSYVAVTKKMEFGFMWFIKALGIISSNYWMLFFVASLVICITFYKGILKTSNDILFSYFLFFITGTYFDSFNGIRQYMAAGFAFLAIYYLINGDIKKYVILILIGSSFHYSCLVMLPLYFIRNTEITVKKTIIILGAVLIGGRFIYSIVTKLLVYTRYRYFLMSVEYRVNATDASLFYVSLLTVLFCVLKLREEQPDKRQIILYNLQVVCESIVLLSLFIPLMWRVQYYFLPLEIIIIPDLIKKVRKENNEKIIKIGIICMYISIVMIYGIRYKGWYDALPYNLFFNAGKI